MKKRLLLLPLIFLFSLLIHAKAGFVAASGKQIVDPYGNNLLLRGIGTGNWMLQEGYMMQSADVAGTQWAFKQKLVETIGVDKTNQFYTRWLDNHFRKIDVDSMARWGFNCVRPALHYKLFTLPIEDEPKQGENTWLESGFSRLDSLVAWCVANRMYVMLDMHGAPGGQGKDAAISDYNPAKPSLWESELNKAKLVALWRKIAERYANNPWVAGYDLLNETNWSFVEANNAPLRALYGRLTNAIREVDTNHMIVIEGNWFANDYAGLTPAWDTNMAYSFHKYWTVNDDASIKWVVDIRNNTNCPIWLGESGENSNRWFTDCIALMERNNIGWSYWPVKKSGINNILRVKTNSDYTDLINSWKGTAAKPSAENAFQALMNFADNHRLENCVVQHDVIDAMIRQPHSTESKPYRANTTASTIYAVDYDLGRAGVAYADSIDADYHLTNNKYTAWNNSYSYRSDGVDIDACTDAVTNGYCVAWIEKGDWMQYTLQSPDEMTYNMLLRYAGQGKSGKVYVEVNGRRASKSITLAPTGGWNIWRTMPITNIIFPAGTVKVKLVFEEGGVNFNYFQLRNPKTVDNTAFEMLNAETASWADQLTINFNKPIDALSGNPFAITIDGKSASVLSTAIASSANNRVEVKVSEAILSTQSLKVSYSGNLCSSGSQPLTPFQNVDVVNLTVPHQTVGDKIEAENFVVNNGFLFEACNDTEGGQNSAYAALDKYLDYYLWIETGGTFRIDFRVSVNTPTAQIALMKDQGGSMIPFKTVSFTQTGGWQNWQTQSTTVALSGGKNIVRLLSRTDGYNLNWFQLAQLTPLPATVVNRYTLYPNPVHSSFFLQFNEGGERQVAILDLQGRVLKQSHITQAHEQIDVADIHNGTYLVKVSDSQQSSINKIQIYQ